MSINGSSYSNQAVQAQERTSLLISCNVSGNPNPSIRLRRSGSTDILTQTSTSEVLNHSIPRLQCSDTDNYTCTGDLTGFTSKQTIFGVNVNCELHFHQYFYKTLTVNLLGRFEKQKVNIDKQMI